MDWWPGFIQFLSAPSSKLCTLKHFCTYELSDCKQCVDANWRNSAFWKNIKFHISPKRKLFINQSKRILENLICARWRLKRPLSNKFLVSSLQDSQNSTSTRIPSFVGTQPLHLFICKRLEWIIGVKSIWLVTCSKVCFYWWYKAESTAATFLF